MKKINNRNNIVFLLGMAIGLIAFITIYGIDVLNVTNDGLIINGYMEKDIAQHYTGWMLYRNSPWQFPLGVGANMAYPYGTTVSYTDSIPLFAIFFKLFRNILPATFQYFGIFVLICFMLQGGFGALLARLFNKNIFVDCLAAAIFVFSPIMIERAFRHCSLTAHFIILAALYFYFRNKGRTDLNAVLPFFIINGLAITIHPYYLPFTFGIMFAFCVENFFLRKKYFSSVIYIAGSIVCTLTVGYIIGAFYVGGSVSSIGYGLYSMNMNALFNPISQGFDNWSSILEIKPNFSYQTTAGVWYGQIEGFNYIGLGVLVFIPVAGLAFIISRRKNIFKDLFVFVENNFGLIFSTVALTVFALGDWITYGGLRIFRLPIPDSIIFGLFGIFRANGRFGWLLVYIITGAVLYSILSYTPEKVSAVLLSVLLAMQCCDMRGVISDKRAYFTNENNYSTSQSVSVLLESSFWDNAAERYDCVYRTYEPVDNKCIEIAQKFAQKGKKVNVAFEARVDHIAFAELAAEMRTRILNGKLDDKDMVLLIDCDDEFIKAAKDNGYTVILVDNVYAICNNHFTAEDSSAIFEEKGVKLI